VDYLDIFYIYINVPAHANLLELSMIVDVERPDVAQVDASVAIAAADSAFNHGSSRDRK